MIDTEKHLSQLGHNFVVNIQSADFNVSGNLLTLEIFKTSAEIFIVVPMFKALDSVFNLNGKEVEISFQNFEYTIKGTMQSIAIETKTRENSSNVNLLFYLKFPEIIIE